MEEGRRLESECGRHGVVVTVVVEGVLVGDERRVLSSPSAQIYRQAVP